MQTIVIASQKGGSGKTTLTAHLAVWSELSEGGKSWLIDTDRQATLTQWHERREQEFPARLDLPFSKIGEGIARLAVEGAAYLFIDTPPAINEQTAKLIALADLVLIPVRPSSADLWAVAETVDTVKRAGKAFLFVITQAKTQARITAQAIAALSEFGRVAPSFMADRVPYAMAFTGGQTAPEISPKGAEAGEIAALWGNIKAFIHETSKTERTVAYG
jgi:chromosome partitioning protein